MKVQEEPLTKGANAFARLPLPPFFLNFGQTFGSRHTISTPSQDRAIIFRLRL
jgi:hypothetical protein